MASGPITSWQIEKKKWKQWQILLSWAPKSLQTVTEAMKLKDKDKSYPWTDSCEKTRQRVKNRDIALLAKACIVKVMIFPIVMYRCESWIIKKTECPRIDAFELWCWRRLLSVTWTARRLQPVYPKGNQSWIFIGRTDAEAEAPIP